MPVDLVPLLSQSEYEALRDSIATSGVLVPVEIADDGTIIDGLGRMRAVAELKKSQGWNGPVPTIVRPGLTVVERQNLRIQLNAIRRQLTAKQRSALVSQLLISDPQQADRAIATMVKVSPSTVGEIRRKLGFDDSTVQSGQRRGRDGKLRRLPAPILAPSETSAMKAAKLANQLPPGSLPDAPLTSDQVGAASRVYGAATKHEAWVNRIADPGPLDNGSTYALIYADPPWSYDDAANAKSKSVSIRGGEARAHYDPMSMEDIYALPVGSIAARDSVLALWGTVPLLQEALTTIARWGFTYKTHIVWDKSEWRSTGSWSRIQHEMLFIATRGNVPAPRPNSLPKSVMAIKKGRHSEKPQEFRDLLVKLFPASRRLEMFARVVLEGWEVWGNEVPARKTRRTAKAKPRKVGRSSPRTRRSTR